MQTEPYEQQIKRWPPIGRHILAQFDAESVVVYQAFRSEIAEFAVSNGYFGGPFSLERMSWIKTNFLWMMFRCGWASKPEQERVLAVAIERAGFETLLSQAVASSYNSEQHPSQSDWQKAVSRSDVRLQWDPDHSPAGGKVARRAIQIGLRGEPLRWYAREGIRQIADITDFVHEQHRHVRDHRYNLLLTPREECYPASEKIAASLGMTTID